MKRLLCAALAISMLCANIGTAYAAGLGELTLTVVARNTNNMFMLHEDNKLFAFVPANSSSTFDIDSGAHELVISAPRGYAVDRVECSMINTSAVEFSLTLIVNANETVDCTIYASEVAQHAVYLPIVAR